MTLRSTSSLLHVPFLSLCTAAGLALASCATAPQSMRAGIGTPASEGTVEAVEADNGNTRVTVRVKHLAPASRLHMEATVYVVWIQPRNGTPQNVGAMDLDSNLEGTLQTVTPHRAFQLFVTPEPAGVVERPTREPVFTTDVVRS